jgi:hypothetical protein
LPQTHDWTLTGVDSGSGTFFSGAPAGGGLDILGFTGTIDGVSITELGGTPGGPATSPSGNFNYDNIFFPGSDPSLDVYGVLVRYNGEGEPLQQWTGRLRIPRAQRPPNFDG